MTQTDLTPEGQKQAEVQQAAREYATRLKMQIYVYFPAIIAGIGYTVVADRDDLLLPIILAISVPSALFLLWSSRRSASAQREIEARYPSA